MARGILGESTTLVAQATRILLPCYPPYLLVAQREILLQHDIYLPRPRLPILEGLSESRGRRSPPLVHVIDSGGGMAVAQNPTLETFAKTRMRTAYIYEECVREDWLRFSGRDRLVVNAAPRPTDGYAFPKLALLLLFSAKAQARTSIPRSLRPSECLFPPHPRYNRSLRRDPQRLPSSSVEPARSPIRALPIVEFHRAAVTLCDIVQAQSEFTWTPAFISSLKAFDAIAIESGQTGLYIPAPDPTREACRTPWDRQAERSRLREMQEAAVAA